MVNLLSPEVVAQDAVIEEISVTGSRIRGANPDSFSPVAVITLEDIQISGAISIGELLQQLPSQGSGLNRNYNNGGSGAVRMDFRNLGAGRTLVLVDGKRWINSGEGANASVDLNTIPTAAIARVEILKDGASAVYGSDAIGAVINIITKDDFEGVEFQAQTGEYFDKGGLANNYQITAGLHSIADPLCWEHRWLRLKILVMETENKRPQDPPLEVHLELHKVGWPTVMWYLVAVTLHRALERVGELLQISVAGPAQKTGLIIIPTTMLKLPTSE